MSLITNIDHLHVCAGIEAVAVVAPNQPRAFRGDDGWCPVLDTAISLFSMTSEQSIRMVVGNYTLLIQSEGPETVAVVLPTGHAIAKSLRRMIRRMSRKNRAPITGAQLAAKQAEQLAQRQVPRPVPTGMGNMVMGGGPMMPPPAPHMHGQPGQGAGAPGMPPHPGSHQMRPPMPMRPGGVPMAPHPDASRRMTPGSMRNMPPASQPSHLRPASGSGMGASSPSHHQQQPSSATPSYRGTPSSAPGHLPPMGAGAPGQGQGQRPPMPYNQQGGMSSRQHGQGQGAPLSHMVPMPPQQGQGQGAGMRNMPPQMGQQRPAPSSSSSHHGGHSHARSEDGSRRPGSTEENTEGELNKHNRPHY